MTAEAPTRDTVLPAILLGVEHPQAYAAVRGLAVAGVPVEGVTQRATRRLGSSRYLKTVQRVGPRDEDVLAFLERHEDRGGVIFPLTDEYMLLVSKNHEMLSKHYVLTTPPWTTLKPIVDQRQLYATARACGVDTPVFFTPKDEADMKRIVAGLDVENEAYLLKTFFDAGPANLDLNRFTVIPGIDRASIEAESMAHLPSQRRIPDDRSGHPRRPGAVVRRHVACRSRQRARVRLRRAPPQAVQVRTRRPSSDALRSRRQHPVRDGRRPARRSRRRRS